MIHPIITDWGAGHLFFSRSLAVRIKNVIHNGNFTLRAFFPRGTASSDSGISDKFSRPDGRRLTFPVSFGVQLTIFVNNPFSTTIFYVENLEQKCRELCTGFQTVGNDGNLNLDALRNRKVHWLPLGEPGKPVRDVEIRSHPVPRENDSSEGRNTPFSTTFFFNTRTDGLVMQSMF